MSENIHHLSGNLLVGSSHFYVDTTNNRVGITTADPQAGLHVNSNAYVDTDFRVGSGIEMNVTGGRIKAGSFEGDGSLLSGVNSDSGSWVNGSSSNIHLAVSTDNVGIGVLDPNYKLDVNGDINIPDGSTLRVGGTPAVFSNWTVHTNGSDIYRSSGNVGIGTTTPGVALDVVGTIRGTGGIITGTSAALLTLNNTTTPTVLRTLTTGGQVYFQSGVATTSDSRANINFTSMYNATNYLTIQGSTGNVGIGTTSPNNPLDVQYNSDSGIRSKGTGSNHASVYIDAGSGYGYLRFQDSGTDKFWIQSTPTGDLAFRPITGSGSDHVFDIRNSGRIGIGDSDPDSILHVQSDVQSGTGGPIKKTAATASTSHYNYILNAPRPGTTSSGAVHFINGSGRSGDGGTNKYTIRNDSGSVDIGRRSVTLVNSTSAPETYNAEQENVDIMLHNGSIWMSPYTGRHRDMGNSGNPWSQYIGKHYAGRILAGMEIENRNDRSTGVSGVYYSNLLHFRAHDHGIYGGSVSDRTMTIRGSKVGIRTETPTYELFVNGSLYYSSGGLNGSDDRIKYNEENITNALDIIDKLTPQKYEKIMTFPSNAKGTWIPTDENWENVKNAETLPWGGFTHGDEFGFIAQDVRNIPEVSFLVSGSEMETKDESVSLEEYTNLNEEEQGAYTRKYMYEENVITVEEYTDLIPENRDKCTPIYTKQVETQTPLALNYQGIFVIAVKAIQELKADLQTTRTELSDTKTDLEERLNTHTHPLEPHTHPLEPHTHPLEEHTHPEIAIEKAKTHELQQRLTLIEHSHAALVARLEALENI